MNDNEDGEIAARAAQYVKDNRKKIVEERTAHFKQEENPVSSFMAGSPGAGKTEASLRLLKNAGDILRIDADELRNYFRECGYDGTNSHVFQKAATRFVHEIHDAALKKRISFLLDGTFASENIARQNIQRSLKRNRDVVILFVYQSPLRAWRFVQERELVEGRRIRSEDFAEKFCASRDVVNKMKQEFGTKITLGLIRKDIDEGVQFYKKSIETIDDHIPKKYNKEQILQVIQNFSVT